MNFFKFVILAVAAMLVLPQPLFAQASDPQSAQPQSGQAEPANGGVFIEAPKTDGENFAPDIDAQIGKILKVENGKAYALSGNFSLNGGWNFYFYAVDEKFSPVAILEPTPVTFKNMRVFKIREGEAKKGDLIFLKQLSPNPPPEPEKK
ncbi:MAG: hypothetical protein J6P03_05850 [Opitutales bacterium]|nr:hypothetical protein [Opitutales bacterium]